MKKTHLTAILATMLTFSTPLFGARLDLGVGGGSIDNGLPDGVDEVFRGITPMALGDPNVYVRQPGNVIYRSAGVSCTDIVSTTHADIFPSPTTIDFTTSPATNFIEIQYSGQISLGNGNLVNRLYFRCSVSQDGGLNYTPCSGMGTNGYIMARRVPIALSPLPPAPDNYPFQVVTNSGSYIGYVAVQPSTATILKLTAKLERVDVHNGTICFSNAIVRY